MSHKLHVLSKRTKNFISLECRALNFMLFLGYLTISLLFSQGELRLQSKRGADTGPRGCLLWRRGALSMRE